MTGEIAPASKSGVEDDSDWDELWSVSARFAAPTTQKRVGRCTKRPPGPSVDDGPSESTTSSAETPEDLGTAIIESVKATLKTRKGYDDLGEALDGETEDTRAPAELEKLNRLAKQMRNERTLDIAVYSIPRQKKCSLELLGTDRIDVYLEPAQRAVWVSHKSHRMIVVSSDLSPERRSDAVLNILSDEIEAIATECGIAWRAGGVKKWLRKLARPHL